jgi:hypothetical protein
MGDYKEKLDDLQRAAKRKARELDEKLGVSDMVEDTARVAGDAARRGAKSIAEGAGHLRSEAGRLAEDPQVKRAADEAKRRAKDAGKTIRDAAGDAGKIIRDAAGPAGEKAEKTFSDAFNYAATATKVAGKGLRASKATAAATAGVLARLGKKIRASGGGLGLIGALESAPGLRFPVSCDLLGGHPPG